MIYRQNSAGKIQPTEYGRMLLPAHCALCNRIGRTPDEVFANLGVDLEYFGTLYLCLECCAEVADFIHFKSPEESDKLKGIINDLADNYNQALEQLKRAKEIINDFIIAGVVPMSSNDGFDDLPVLKVESDANIVNSILESYESKPA